MEGQLQLLEHAVSAMEFCSRRPGVMREVLISKDESQTLMDRLQSTSLAPRGENWDLNPEISELHVVRMDQQALAAAHPHILIAASYNAATITHYCTLLPAACGDSTYSPSASSRLYPCAVACLGAYVSAM